MQGNYVKLLHPQARDLGKCGSRGSGPKLFELTTSRRISPHVRSPEDTTKPAIELFLPRGTGATAPSPDMEAAQRSGLAGERPYECEVRPADKESTVTRSHTWKVWQADRSGDPVYESGGERLARDHCRNRTLAGLPVILEPPDGVEEWWHAGEGWQLLNGEPEGWEPPQAIADDYPGWQARYRRDGTWEASCPAATVTASSAKELPAAIEHAITKDEAT